MIYLLIDSCSLLQLIQQEGYNNYLSELLTHINNNKIAFITHELVIQEWEKHKEKHKRDKERKLLFYNKQNNNIENNSSTLLPSKILVNTNHLELQITLIDKLLSKAKEILRTPEIIKNDFAERYRKNLAPFHIKKDSQNDWEIIGTTCNYCEVRGIRDIYFLSYNHTDFADENEINRTIHPTLQSRFLKVKINYFKNYSDFFKELETYYNFPSQLISYQLPQNEKYTYKATLKKTDLESLYYLFNDLYEEINFIPIHILKKYYPFENSDESSTYYSIFTLSYVPENLINFFENVKVGEDKELKFIDETLVNSVNNFKEKTEYVLRHLTHNLIFNLSGEKSRKTISTFYDNPIFCNCIKCTLNRFEFHKTFKDLKSETTGVKEKLKQAYIHYQIGNFKSASKLYQEIVNEALDEKKYISYFIAKYNLKHLSAFLSNPFYNKEVDTQLVEELYKIDPIEEAVKLKTHSDYNLLLFIAQEDFFTEPFQNIREKVNSILDHYYSQLNGGWSSNNYVWSLIEEFAKLETFLNSNYILFDKYSNFLKLFEAVIEGVFASHAIAENQEDRFKLFDDYWVHKFILYGNEKVIKKYFNRFNLKSLKYNLSSIEKDSFIELTEHLFKNEKLIIEGCQQYADKQNGYFIDKYNKIFENSITMGSLLELDSNTLNKFAGLVINLLKTETSLYRSSLKNIKFFISQKGNKLDKTILKEYFEHFLNNDKEHDNDTLAVIIDSFEDGELDAILEKDFDEILHQTIVVCEKCGSIHSPEILLSIYDKVGNLRKEVISKKIQEKLNSKFEFNLFYLSSIQDVIAFDEEKIFSLVNELNIDKKQRSARSMFTGSIDYQNHYLDEILNLCFKFNIDTTTNQFQKFREIGPYYEWLINMDAFNYDKFNYEWVLNYKTVYYFKAMSKSKSLTSALVEFLKSNFHEGVEHVLIRMTFFAK